MLIELQLASIIRDKEYLPGMLTRNLKGVRLPMIQPQEIFLIGS